MNELECGESHVNAQQQNALPAFKFAGGKWRQRQDCHDGEHNGNIHHEGGIHTADGLLHRNGKRRNGDGCAGHQDQVEDIGPDDVAE